MKRYFKFIVLSIALAGIMASCQCKTCKKESEISVQICKGEGSQTDYDNAIANMQNGGYTCN